MKIGQNIIQKTLFLKEKALKNELHKRLQFLQNIHFAIHTLEGGGGAECIVKVFGVETRLDYW